MNATKLISFAVPHPFSKMEIQLEPEGAYVFGYKIVDGVEVGAFDYLQDSVELTIEFANEKWGVPIDSWKRVD